MQRLPVSLQPHLAAVLLFTATCFNTTPSLAVTGSVFVAQDPYVILVNDQPQAIDLGGVPITFDFGGSAPFINPNTGVGDFDTLQFWDANQGKAVTLNNWAAVTEAPNGVPGRIFKAKQVSHQSYTAIGYKAGDRIVEGALRTQLNTYPVPSRRRFIWDFVTRFGGKNLKSPWAFTPRGTHPGVVWELQTDGMDPALAMVVDTDPDRPHKLALHFDAHTDPSVPATRLGIATRLAPKKDIRVVIDAFLDERQQADGGQGYVKVWVNGKKVADAERPTLTAQTTEPHYWKMAMYLYKDTSPLSSSLFGYWKRARMLVPKEDQMAACFAFEQMSPNGRRLKFIFELHDEAKIAEARSILADPTSLKNHVQGKIIPRPALYNPKWSYHLAPDSISFFEMQTEVCDANAVYVEEHLDEIGGSTLPNSFWCPWSSRLSREVTP